MDAGRRCSIGDGKFFFRCSPTKGQPVDGLGAQIRQLVLEAKQRLRQEQAAKGQAAFTKTVPNGFATAIDYPGIGASSRPPPVPPKSSHDAAGNGECRVSGESGNQSGGSAPAAVSDRVQETAIDAVGDDGRLESTEGQTKRGTTGAVERCRRRKCKRKRSPEIIETSADASANADQCQAGLYDNAAPPELPTPGANFVSDFDATLPSRRRPSSRGPRLRTLQSGTPSQPAAAFRARPWGSERANSEIRRISFTTELSSVNLAGPVDVLQELRDANANVTVAVRAAARNRRYQGFASSSSASQSPPSRNTPPTTLWTPMKRES
ncbi:hypothetical protein SprV_1002914100 [Sparganum proliferum]